MACAGAGTGFRKRYIHAAGTAPHWPVLVDVHKACADRTLASAQRAVARRSKDLKRYIDNAVEVDPDRPVLVDKYLDRADELDVDALCDREGNVVIAGIMQHIEQAGVHSGMSYEIHMLPWSS